MSEKLKHLLDKINEEGIIKAEDNKKHIEALAKLEAKRLIEKANLDAKNILENASMEAKKLKDTTELALKQASRDLILSLKDEVRKIFEKVIQKEVRNAISHEELANIIRNIIEKSVKGSDRPSSLSVLIGEGDYNKLKDTLISKLKDTLKSGIEFKQSQNITSGFSISFDKGKSYFDFTEEGLKEALSAYLNPEIRRIIG